MIIRKSTLADIPQMLRVFEAARRFMARTGNPHQWAPDYPGSARLEDDILSGDSYVCTQNDVVVATFMLRAGIDPTYQKIYDGAWPSDVPYATIHRIASDGSVHGVFGVVLSFARARHSVIRIDTHADNKVMQRLLAASGFAYCGIIHCWSGEPRLAYQIG